ncbi:MAG TPA: leucine-rich repeat protein [Defluviitaleaceae bacterium]|nr:leucine-rich repeat protein [Defluviitaleaceae bacterium]
MNSKIISKSLLSSFIMVFLLILFPLKPLGAVDSEFVDSESGLKLRVITEEGDTGTVEVIRHDYTESFYNIPATIEYNGIVYTVTSIGEYAFYDCKSLTSVTIPATVLAIRSHAFYLCDNLVSVVISEGV